MKFKRYVIFLSVILIITIFLKLSIKKENKRSFDIVEDLIISIYEEDDSKILSNLEKIYLTNDDKVYPIINELVPIDILELFYKNKFGKTKGNAEYKMGLKLIFSNKIGQAVENFKKASMQGNTEATYFLANYLYSMKRFEEAFVYYEKAYRKNDYRITRIYNHMKENYLEYKEIEKLVFKYNQNKITDYERFKLGKFLLKINDSELAYKTLKPFLEDNNPDALFAKALYLELEGEEKEANLIFKKLIDEFKYPNAILKYIESKKNLKKKDKKELITFIDNFKVYNNDISFLKANLLFETDNWTLAKEIYDKLNEKKYAPVYQKLANYYEDIDLNEPAIKFYELAFKNGNLKSSLKLAKLKALNYEKNLKLASKLGCNEASMYLSNISTDSYEKKKYAIYALAQGELKSLETLIDLAYQKNEKHKIKVYTNILINN